MTHEITLQLITNTDITASLKCYNLHMCLYNLFAYENDMYSLRDWRIVNVKRIAREGPPLGPPFQSP